MNIIRYIIFILTGLAYTSLLAQSTDIRGVFQVKPKAVELHWACTNDQNLKKAFIEGFYIKRIEWNTSDLPGTAQFTNSTTININPIKPYSKTDVNWETTISKYSSADLIYSYIHENNINENTEVAMGLCMLACDIYRPCSQAAGLLFIDSTISTGKNYAYLIGVNNNPNIQPFCIIVNTSTTTQYLPIEQLNVNYKHKKLWLSWNYLNYKKQYSAYLIERSEDGKTYLPVNKTPLIGITTQYEPEKNSIEYNDTTAKPNQTYYYRLRGINKFGETCLPSLPIKINTIPEISGEVIIDSVTFLNNKNQMVIHWGLTDKNAEKVIKEIHINHCNNVIGPYKKINATPLLKNKKSFTTTATNRINYYRIEVIGIGGDTLYSSPKFVVLPDETPPAIPINLKGKTSKDGIVKITWKNVNDKDLNGYKIFRANSLTEEFIELTHTLLKDTFFIDSISLKTLTPNIYYGVCSVDSTFNSSAMSIPLKLKRPDILAPVQPIINELKNSNDKIIIKWTNSSSKDVEKHELWRSTNNNTFELILTCKKNDTTNIFTDTNLINNNIYAYKIICFDDSENKTESQTRSINYRQLHKKALSNFSGEVNRAKRQIILSWVVADKEIWKYTIYRSKKGEQLQILTTLSPENERYIDEDLNIGNIYSYAIKAIYLDGTETKITIPIEIQY